MPEPGEYSRRYREEAPPLAWIQEMKTEELPLERGIASKFVIAKRVTGEFALISPDVATCPECLRDCREPGNRRFHYPFTNCTNCGPRYTIIRDIPYDRASTTMASFRMCAQCQREYDDPANRRFHAQPNACPVCGPELSGEPARGTAAAWRRARFWPSRGWGDTIWPAIRGTPRAVERLRARKRRSDKPFALMARDLAAVGGASARSRTRTARRSPVGEGRSCCCRGAPFGHLPEAVAPGNRTLGVMLPYTPLHHLLFDGAPFDALVMTSGNISEEPIVVDNAEARGAHRRGGGLVPPAQSRHLHARRRFGGAHVRGARAGAAAVARVSLRRRSIWARNAAEILACGGELKNAFCLTKGRHAVLSQHIGDMENYETLVFFEETLANLKKLFRVEPRAVAHDLHPGYLSTKYALRVPDLEKIGVQHHHAHIASCMAENGLRGKAIGVALDGTGYGTDGKIWGGEFMVADYGGFERRAHLRYVPLAGGDAAVRQPWRPALAYLVDTFGPAAEFPELAIWRAIPESRRKAVRSG